MQPLFTLKLYTTSSCHLCDDAYNLLLQLTLPEMTLVEIANNEALLDCYGTRIPVLQRTDNNTELDWPFSQEQVIIFLSP